MPLEPGQSGGEYLLLRVRAAQDIKMAPLLKHLESNIVTAGCMGRLAYPG